MQNQRKQSLGVQCTTSLGLATGRNIKRFGILERGKRSTPSAWTDRLSDGCQNAGGKVNI